MPDHDRLRWEELASISEFAHTLSDEQWDHESLCDGWRVRDVVSHMTLGYTTPMFSMIGMLAKYGFNVPKGSAKGSVAYGSAHTPAEILAVFDTIPNEHVHKGISRVIKPKESLLDHIVHQQDMRRPLGMPRQVPEERLVAALDVAPDIGGFVGAKSVPPDSAWWPPTSTGRTAPVQRSPARVRPSCSRSPDARSCSTN